MVEVRLPDGSSGDLIVNRAVGIDGLGRHDIPQLRETCG